MPAVVTIGLQQLYYSAVEGQGPVEVCITVLAGDVTGSSYTISYTTVDDLAEGMWTYIEMLYILVHFVLFEQQPIKVCTCQHSTS